MIDESNFESVREAFRVYENASKREQASLNRAVRLSDSLDYLRDRGLCTESDILQAANLIVRKRKANDAVYESNRVREQIRNKLIGQS